MVFLYAVDDTKYMKRALLLARRARGKTSPNPMVGAVLVRDGRILSEDYHRRPGTPHAEALALQSAGEGARGATLYVTLEPCCHKDKRTPPCTEAIISSGVSRVVAAMQDPNPRVSGKGVQSLRAAGIQVDVGMLEDEAGALNEAYVKFMTTGKPLVILKTAMTLDGKIATPKGQSRWITGEEARKLVHMLRSRSDAILTAIGTVKADDPRLTSRIKGGKNPLRVVIDPELEIPAKSRLLQTPPETLIVTRTNNNKANYLNKSGIKMLFYKEKLKLNWLIKKLASMGIMSVLIEGGSSLNAHALNEKIVDRVMFFVAPKIIGGRDSFPAVGGSFFRKLESAYRIEDLKVSRVGQDILVEGRVRYSPR